MVKKTLIIIVCLLMTCSYSYADKNERKYKKYILELDIDSTAMQAPSVVEFWNIVWKKNERLQKYVAAFKSNKTSAVKAHEYIRQSLLAAANEYDYLETEADNTDCYIASLLERLGVLCVYPDTKLYIVNSPVLNASTLPDGRIYLNTGLFDKGLTDAQVLGVCAHEFAHFLLQHAKVECYKFLKKERTNKIAAQVSAAIQAGAAIFSASNGVEVDMNAFNETIINMFETAELQAHRYRYKYSREQEIEADIVAYRLLEYLGYGGDKYIEALSLLESPYEYISETSTHPLTAFRIGLLKYMAAHPKIGTPEPKEELY